MIYLPDAMYNGRMGVQSELPIILPGKRTKQSQRDRFREYFTDDLTPSRLGTILKQIDQGDVAALCELNQEMEAKDSHLFSVSTTRRSAVTALEWEIIADVSEEDQKGADESAEYVRKSFKGLRSLESTFKHLQTATSTNVAVTELVWRRGKLVDTIDVPGGRLIQSWRNNYLELMTDECPTGEPMPAGKFVVFTPEPLAGFPFRVSIARAQAWVYIVKHYALADWQAYSELFGQPLRVAKIAAGSTPAQIAIVAEMLRDMSSDGWAVFSDAVDLQFVNASGTITHPYPVLIDWVEKKQSIIYLGQTLTTDIGEGGSRAAAQVHENVRKDILTSDLKNEADCIRDKIIRPMVQIAFPGKNAPVPHFKRKVQETRNIEEDRVNLEKLKFAREVGLDIDKDQVYELLRLPKPTGKGELLGNAKKKKIPRGEPFPIKVEADESEDES